MGCIQSFNDRSENDTEYDKNLKTARTESSKINRILLLGAGDSGKSTVVKQMKTIHGKGFSQDDKLEYRGFIFQNILISLANIAKVLKDFKLKCVEKSAEDLIKLLVDSENLDEQLFYSLDTKQVLCFWNDPAVQACLKRSNEFHLMDNIIYFMDNFKRIKNQEYLPSETDIINARVKTTGFVETSFSFKGLTIILIDVGGQRSERRKWIHIFDNVSSILFMTSLSEYDQTLEEDNTINRMRESIKLFDSVTNNSFFVHTPFIIFFNKLDVFEKKFLTSKISKFVPEFNGNDENKDVAIKFIQKLFTSQNRSNKTIYLFCTTATNKENISYVFNSAIDVIVNKNLTSVGLI